ncbi:hypothetical protein FA15DRAFT_628334, partial [Coprinopsis marcescibilis]
MTSNTRPSIDEDDFELVHAEDVPGLPTGTTATTTLPGASPNTPTYDIEALRKLFSELNTALQRTVDKRASGAPLFHANLDKPVFTTHLENLPADMRQSDNCNACGHFLNRYGDLCTINDDDGTLSPLLWPNDADIDAVGVPDIYHGAVKAIRSAFAGKGVRERYELLNVDDLKLGREKTTETAWRHFSVTLDPKTWPVIQDTSGIVDMQTANGMLTRIIDDNTLENINKTHHLLHEKLPYSTSHKPAIEWLRKFVVKVDGLGSGQVERQNLVHLYAAKAWAGCLSSLRGGMIGELLEMVSNGLEYHELEAKWNALANPTNYLRPTALPSVGNIEVAEKTFQQTGYTKDDLKRFYVATDELPEGAFLWRDKGALKADAEGAKDVDKGAGAGEIFGDLKKMVQDQDKSKSKSAAADHPSPDDDDGAPATSISFRNFAKRVLPTATSLEFFLQKQECVTFFTRGAPGSKSPFVFDAADPANTMSWYYWGSSQQPEKASLKPGWNRVSAITTFPHMWDYLTPGGALQWEGGDQAALSVEEAEGGKGLKWLHARHDVRFLWVLEGVKETARMPLCLFPTFMKNVFHGVRKSVEAFSAQGVVEWPWEGDKDEEGAVKRV